MNSKEINGAKSSSKSVTDSKKVIDSKRIEDSFLALQKMCKLTKEERESEPLFGNERATILLHITPKSMRKQGVPNKILLPHPLSFRRAVCFIAKNMDKPAQSGKILQILSKVGVVGLIKAIPLSLVKCAQKEKNFEALDEIASLYDTHLSEEDLNVPELSNALNRQRKRILRANLQQGSGLYEAGFRHALATTLVRPEPNGQSIDLRVAHVGMSAAQAVENVRTALEFLVKRSFAEGYSALDSVRLKNGDKDSKAFDLYLDGEAKLKEKERKERKEAEAIVALKRKEKKDRAFKEAQIPEIPRSSLQLGTGLAALTQLLGWTGVGGPAPRFTDKGATIHLRLRPTQDKPQAGHSTWVTLPHPLSLKRRVCAVVPSSEPNAPEDAKAANLKDAVLDAGVEGFVEVLRCFALPRSKNELQQLAAQYDTYIADSTCAEQCSNLAGALSTKGKALVLNDFADDAKLESNVAAALAGSAVAVSKGEYRVTVGHTGLTRAQLAKNLSSALASLLTMPPFPDSLEQYDIIRLENGLGLGVPVFLNKNQATSSAIRDEDDDSETETLEPVVRFPNVIVSTLPFKRKSLGDESKPKRARRNR